MVQWSSLPVEIQQNILNRLSSPYPTHVSQSWHSMTQASIYHSVEIQSLAHLLRFIHCLEISHLGHLVYTLSLLESATYSIRKRNDPDIMNTLIDLCPNVRRLCAERPGRFLWLFQSNASIVWREIEHLPWPQGFLTEYVKCARKFKHLHEFVIADELSLVVFHALLDDFKSFCQLKTVYVYAVSNSNILGLIRERDYLSHVKIVKLKPWHDFHGLENEDEDDRESQDTDDEEMSEQESSELDEGSDSTEDDSDEGTLSDCSCEDCRPENSTGEGGLESESLSDCTCVNCRSVRNSGSGIESPSSSNCSCENCNARSNSQSGSGGSSDQSRSEEDHDLLIEYSNSEMGQTSGIVYSSSDLEEGSEQFYIISNLEEESEQVYTSSVLEEENDIVYSNNDPQVDLDQKGDEQSTSVESNTEESDISQGNYQASINSYDYLKESDTEHDDHPNLNESNLKENTINQELNSQSTRQK